MLITIWSYASMLPYSFNGDEAPLLPFALAFALGPGLLGCLFLFGLLFALGELAAEFALPL